ncbi:MAG: 50S ribosomal protein L23 [Patescibacteria group bacterium]
MSIIKRITKKKTDAPEKEAEVKAKQPAAKKTTKKAAEPKAAPSKMVSAFTARTLLAPLVTEKAAHLADAGVYAFLVPVTANRVAVNQAFRELYKVTPVKVNIIRVHGKEHRFGGVMSRQSDWKKALVSVPKGTRIDIFEKI